MYSWIYILFIHFFKKLPNIQTCFKTCPRSVNNSRTDHFVFHFRGIWGPKFCNFGGGVATPDKVNTPNWKR